LPSWKLGSSETRVKLAIQVSFAIFLLFFCYFSLTFIVLCFKIVS